MLTHLAQLLYPTACLLCQRRSPDQSAVVCPACARRCLALLPPVCQRCGLPLRGAYDLFTLCRHCTEAPGSIDAARAPFLYREGIAEAVHAFKYRGRRRLGRWLAEAMAHTALTALPTAPWDGVVAMPLHWAKRRVRGWNPAETLAAHLATALGVPQRRRAVRRIRWTATQTRLTPAQRQRNVREAFRADPAAVRGRTLLLIDDVLTTGATAQACAAALKSAGACRVDILTAARAVPA